MEDHYNRSGGWLNDIHSAGENSRSVQATRHRHAPAESGAPLIRFLLLLGALVIGAGVVATHGFRGIVALVLVLLVVSAPRTRAWSVSERFLVRLTGSRRAAAILVMSVVIVAVLAVDVYSFVHS